MKKFRKKILIMGLPFVAALMLTIGSSFVSADSPRTITNLTAQRSEDGSALARRCLPDNAKDVHLRGTEEFEMSQESATSPHIYYLFSFTQEEEFQELVVLTFDGICGISHSTWLGEDSMVESMDLEVARSLRLQSYQSIAEEIGGTEMLKQEVLSIFDSEYEGSESGNRPIQFAPENVWALEQLGIILPEGEYTVLEVEPYVPGQFVQGNKDSKQ